jgi:GNAT superfamily N-acetyltransferase
VVGDRWPERCRSADVYVGTIDDVVIAYLVAELGEDAIVRIDQVWVTPEARELGFGDELLATAIEAARARGAVAVEGQALPGDRHTKNLYERAGIVARLITTYRNL